MKTIPVLVAAICAAASAEYASYEGYKVFQIYPENERQFNIVRNLSTNIFYDVWSGTRGVGIPATIMVNPDHQNTFIKMLDNANIHHSVFMENVQSFIKEERTRQLNSPKIDKGRISFEAYQRYQTIQDYLQELADNYPDIVTLENIGTSYENRPISMIKIGTGGENKPIILVDGGIHAREWISPAVVTYLIQELVENEGNRDMIETTDWYIIPVLNPDGYEYTHTDVRLWRKTRSVGNMCIGVDGNRNFAFHWMETGASSFECDVDYAGPAPFSESETAALRDVVNRDRDNIRLYLTFHSYGNFLLYPWGYTSDLPDDVEELNSLATDVEAAIASVYGSRYIIGSSTNVLYAAAGGSDDWVKAVGGVELSYTIELPGDNSGFILPPERILEVSIETFEGVRVYQRYIEQKFTIRN